MYPRNIDIIPQISLVLVFSWYLWMGLHTSVYHLQEVYLTSVLSPLIPTDNKMRIGIRTFALSIVWLTGSHRKKISRADLFSCQHTISFPIIFKQNMSNEHLAERKCIYNINYVGHDFFHIVQSYLFQ